VRSTEYCYAVSTKINLDSVVVDHLEKTITVRYTYDVFEVPVMPDGDIDHNVDNWMLLMSTSIVSHAFFNSDLKLHFIRDLQDLTPATMKEGHMLELITLGSSPDAIRLEDGSIVSSPGIPHPYGQSHPQLQPLPPFRECSPAQLARKQQSMSAENIKQRVWRLHPFETNVK